MFNGHGRRAVVFPGDGHPTLANASMDLTGDARDEIITWDAHELWVYTQDDAPRSGKIYRPYRNGPNTESNYRITVSVPGWTSP